MIGASTFFGSHESFDWYVVGLIEFSPCLSVHSFANFRVRGMCTEHEAGVGRDN